MSRSTIYLALFFTALLCASLLMANNQSTAQSLGKMPLSFTKNMGQWDDRVLFRANSGGAILWFTKDGFTYQFTRTISRSGDPMDRPDQPSAGQNRLGFDAASLDSRFRGNDKEGGNDMERDSIEQLVLTAKFVGANPNPEVFAEGQLEYKCNYFLGNDPSKWQTDVPNYEAITLKDIYPGIDLKYSAGGTGQAAYEFIAAPNADIAQIKVVYDGAEETSIDAEGKLTLKTKWGDMTATINPAVNIIGLASPRFLLSKEQVPGMAEEGQSLSKTNSGTLEMTYSTFIGGIDGDEAFAVAVDGTGSTYVTGYTLSSDFPTQNPYQSTHHGGHMDAFVFKLSYSGNELIYSTYLGGEGWDKTNDIAVNGSGNAYVTGYTTSSNFPTMNPYQTFQGTGAFVTKLSSTGNSLIYSTYLGGGGYDEGYGISVDGNGSAYVTGLTSSYDFPVQNPFQKYLDEWADAFVTKFSYSGSSLLYSTYLGGRNDDYGYSIAVDDSGNAYVTGLTYSPDFPTLNPYQANQPGADVFVTKFSGSGASLSYSTYLGGAGVDCGHGIAVDDSGCAYVTGETFSSDFPTMNPYETDQGVEDAFVTKLSTSGNTLIYSTYLGGVDYDWGSSIVVDGSNCAYVTGYTSSYDFPTQSPLQAAYQGIADAFVTRLSSSGDRLIYSTFLGGVVYDLGYDIAVDVGGNAYVTGETMSPDFPTKNPGQTHQGYNDAFVTKLTWTLVCPRGDVNTDARINLLDLVILRNYILLGVPTPQSLQSADVDCSGGVNISDVVYLANYYFRNGPAPCAGCE